MSFVKSLLTDLAQPFVRVAIPVGSILVFLQARSFGWLHEPSWILLLLALFLVPLFILQRRRVDLFSITVALLVGTVGFALSGLVAGVVLGVGWLVPAIASGRFADVVDVVADTVVT